MFLRSKFPQEIMPKKRSRSVSSKQSLPTDNNNNNNSTTLTSPTINCSSAAADSPSIFTSPRLFLPFSTKTPTCVSEANSYSSNAIKKPFFSERKPNWSAAVPSAATGESKSKHLSLSNGGEPTTPVGLSGLVDALNDDELEMDKKLRRECRNRTVLFGSPPLRIQIPPTQQPASPIEFGVKNKSSQLALYSPPISISKTPPVSSIYVETPRHFVGSLSPTEMELSEDYTCVITRGPNPTTTHIFDNCVVVKCNDGFGFVPSIIKDDDGVSLHPPKNVFDGAGFLSFCHACKKSLGQGKDIFMYRGEKAFCSRECRSQEMLFDEGKEDECSLELSDPL